MAFLCVFLSFLSLALPISQSRTSHWMHSSILTASLVPSSSRTFVLFSFFDATFPPRSFLLLRHAAYISQWFLSNSLPLPLPLLLLLGFVCPNLLRNRPAVNNASPNGIGFVRVCGKVGTRKDHQIVSYPTYFISRFAIPCFIIESCIMDDHHAGWR